MEQRIDKLIVNLDEMKAIYDEFASALKSFGDAYLRLQLANDKVSSFELKFKDESGNLQGESLQTLRNNNLQLINIDPLAGKCQPGCDSHNSDEVNICDRQTEM